MLRRERSRSAIFFLRRLPGGILPLQSQRRVRAKYGPQMLNRVVSFFAQRSDEVIEGRFADEDQWRPLAFFLALWNSIPPSAHTIERLNRAGLNSDCITECTGRKLLRDKQNSKPPTSRQINYLRDAGIQIEDGLTRKQVGDLIREHERTASKELLRLQEAPEIAAYKRRLEKLGAEVRELLPAWTPKGFDDAESYLFYVATVEEGLDHARLADLESLQSGPFGDGLDMDAYYYLEFTREPTAVEMRRFQAALFQAYLSAESEEFDHLTILKQTLPMIRVSLM